MYNGDFLLAGLMLVIGLWAIYSVVKLTIVRRDLERYRNEITKDNAEDGQERWVNRNGEQCPACKDGKICVYTYNGGEGWEVSCNKCGVLFDED